VCTANAPTLWVAASWCASHSPTSIMIVGEFQWIMQHTRSRKCTRANGANQAAMATTPGDGEGRPTGPWWCVGRSQTSRPSEMARPSPAHTHASGEEMQSRSPQYGLAQVSHAIGRPSIGGLSLERKGLSDRYTSPLWSAGIHDTTPQGVIGG